MSNEILLGIYEKAFPTSFDWEKRCRIASRIGYDFIELSVDESDERLERLDWNDFDCENLRRMQKTYNIKISTMCLSALRRYPLGSSDPAISNQGLTTLVKAIRLASRLGISIVQVAGYDVYGEQSTDETIERFLEHIGKALEEASTRNITLAIENMETSATDSLEKVMHFIRRFNHPLLKIYADMGNLIAMGNDIATQLDAARGHIAAFHIKDVMPNICRDIPFEKGMVDFDRVFLEIKRIDFSGMCLLEMWANPKGNPVKEASHAYRFITEKIRHAGLGKKEYN